MRQTNSLSILATRKRHLTRQFLNYTRTDTLTDRLTDTVDWFIETTAHVYNDISARMRRERARKSSQYVQTSDKKASLVSNG